MAEWQDGGQAAGGLWLSIKKFVNRNFGPVPVGWQGDRLAERQRSKMAGYRVTVFLRGCMIRRLLLNMAAYKCVVPDHHVLLNMAA